MPRATQKIPEEAWNEHREEILSLYLELGKPLPQVMKHMSERHNFLASKNQYETAFKKWGMDKSKNLSDAEWKFIENRKRKREEMDPQKETAVYLNKRRVASSHIEKGLTRPNRGNPQGSGPSPERPKTVWVCTPEGAVLAKTPQTPHTPHTPHETHTPRTPGSQLVRTPGGTWAGTASAHGVKIHNLPWNQFSRGFLNQGSGYHEAVVQLFNETKSHPGHFQLSGPSRPDASAVQAISRSKKDKSKLSTAQLTESMLFPNLLPRSTENDANSVDYACAVHSHLETISFGKDEGDLWASAKALVGPFTASGLSEFIKYLAYLSSNNMLSTDQSDRFLRWITETGNQDILRSFFSAQSGTIAALARSLFESALRSDDVETVKIFINAGVNLNVPTRYTYRSYFQTPLQIAAAFPGTIMLHTLLKAGATASINRPFDDDGSPPLFIALEANRNASAKLLLEYGATASAFILVSAFRSFVLRYNDPEGFMEIFPRLLNAGADVNAPAEIEPCGTALQCAVRTENTELVDLLLDLGADVNAPGPEHNHGIGFDEDEDGDEDIYGDEDGRPHPNRGTLLQHVIWFCFVLPAYTGYDKDRANGTLQSRLCRMLIVDSRADINAPGNESCSSRLRCKYGVNALQAAVKYNRVTMVKKLIAAGAKINAPPAEGEYGGRTALQLAAEKGNKNLLLLLLEHEADVNAPPAESRGVTALQAACRHGDYAIVQILLQNGADVNAPPAESHGFTALQAACYHGNYTIVRTLLQNGADVNATTSRNYGVTALEGAIRTGYLGVITMILEYGAKINFSRHDYLSIEEEPEEEFLGNLVEIATALLHAGASINDPIHHSFFRMSLKSRDEASIRWFLSVGIDVTATNGYGTPILQEIIQFGDQETIALLLDSGINMDGESAFNLRNVLWPAIHRMDINIVQRLILAGVNINIGLDYVSNPLPLAVHLAAIHGDDRIVNLLLFNGADINASVIFDNEDYESASSRARRGTDALGTTALLCAMREHNTHLIHLLVNAGANVNQTPQPFGGWTPLQAAAENGSVEHLKLLMEKGAGVNAPAYPEAGRTALQAAASGGHKKVTEILLAAGASPNLPAAENRGITALQGAAIGGYLGIAMMLLEAGADPNAPAAKFNGRTALEGAAEHGRLDMVQLLLNAGADLGGNKFDRARNLAEENGHAIVVKHLESGGGLLHF